jgi:ribonucleoside-diphosphate reductase alpha chain
MGKKLKPNTEKVLQDRYYLKDPQGIALENEFKQPCTRIGNFVALAHTQKYGDPRQRFFNKYPVEYTFAADKDKGLKDVPADVHADYTKLANEFTKLHVDQVFAANSPTWFNAGNPFMRKMLSACFILHVPDDIPGIFKAVQDGAIIGKFGGGIGMDYSQIRPRNARTNSGGLASGAISFMGPFQGMSEAIVQGGKRRIAMMAMLACWHPEILWFIDCKKKTGPERLKWLIEKYNLSYEDAREIMIGVNWLKIHDRGSASEKEEWNTPYNGFNISVKVTREFMNAVENDELFMIRQAIVEDTELGPRAQKVRYEPWTGPIFDPRGDGKNGLAGNNTDGLIVYKNGVAYVKARRLWYERLMTSAWEGAEPGIMFDDEVNDDNPVKSLGPIHNSNPCGEYFQVDFNSCNLGSINLGKFFKADKKAPTYQWQDHIAWDKLAQVARTATRFLDYVVTMNDYPIKDITDTTNASRPVGLGVMGFADLLIDLQVAYGSKLSVEIAEAIMQWVNYHAWLESAQLASEFGEFPELKNNREYFDSKMQRLTDSIQEHVAFPKDDSLPKLVAMYKKHGVRNCHVTVIAPTGTISLIDECSSGIEPIFAFFYKRQDTVGVRWYVYDRAGKYLKEIHESEIPAEFKEDLDKQYGWLVEKYGDKLPGFFKDANSVTPEEHILIQAAFQKFCDNAISKTCNMPEDSTVEDVAKIYDLAHRSGLKGCTVYRDGSRHGVLIRETKKDLKVTEVPQPKPVIQGGQLVVEPRPEFLEGGTRVVPDGKDGKLYVTMNYHPRDGRIFEILLRENAGNEWIELAGRLVSLLLRSNVPVKEIRQQLRRVGGQSAIFYNQKFFSSPVQLLDDVLFDQAAPYFAAKVKGMAVDYEELERLPMVEESQELEPINRGPKCPKCGSGLRAIEGCYVCPNSAECGYSKCN